MNRFLKYINYIIALLCVAAAGLIYWYGWRVLPQTSGTVTAPVSSAVTIARDARGVPHITAATPEDAWFAQGYVTAQDRLFQMEFTRRQAAGELAEIFGMAGLESDLQQRRLMMRRLAEQHARTMPAADRAVLAAYTRGVNFYLETHAGKMPVEFTLLGTEPAPWSITDSILTGLEMYRSLTSSWRDELVKLGFQQGGDPDMVEFLFPTRTGGEPAPGSNAWAISGKRTRSGKPILASDPHLAPSLPGIWYQVHLKTPQFDVEGVSLPGLPAVLIGHNSRIAWGLTNLQFDVQDLFRERLNTAAGVALYRNSAERLRQEQELIRVKGSVPREVSVLVTRHGPVILSEQNLSYSLEWTAAAPGLFSFPFDEIDRAGNWSEFRKALERFAGPPQNFVYADTDGNIGYQVAGKLPVRRSWDGDVPAEGSSGEQEWDGFIPFSDLPSSYNPESGIIVTANQNPFPPDYAYRVNGNFAPPYRARQIEARLSAKAGGWEPAAMLDIQKDVYSSFGHFLAQQMLAAYEQRGKGNPRLEGVEEVLRGWNGQMEKGLAAPMLVELTFRQLRKAMADRVAAGKADTYDLPMSEAVVERLLKERPKSWFPDYDLLLQRCLLEALDEGAKSQGTNVRNWDWGKFNQWLLRAPVVGQLPIVDQIPWIGSFLRIGPAPMSGSPTTVKQTTRRLGPSMRMVVDLGNLDNSLMNILTGESGQVLSGHLRDQWDAYYSGQSFPMQYSKVEVKDSLQLVPGAAH